METYEKEFAKKGTGSGLPESSQIQRLFWRDDLRMPLRVQFWGGKWFAYDVLSIGDSSPDKTRKIIFEGWQGLSPGQVLSRYVKDKCKYQEISSPTERVNDGLAAVSGEEALRELVVDDASDAPTVVSERTGDTVVVRARFSETEMLRFHLDIAAARIVVDLEIFGGENGVLITRLAEMINVEGSWRVNWKVVYDLAKMHHVLMVAREVVELYA